MLKTTLAKLLTVKAAAVAAASIGGIALAAGTGVLPVELPDTPASPPTVRQAPARPTELPAPAADQDNAGGTPSPSTVGMCLAYAAEVGNNPGKALESPAFTALVTAAGGTDKVDGFCQTQTAAAEHAGAANGVPAPPAANEHASNATSHPQAPTSHPTGPPTAPPTGPRS